MRGSGCALGVMLAAVLGTAAAAQGQAAAPAQGVAPAGAAPGPQIAAAAQGPATGALSGAIDALGSFDLTNRTNAARAIRRAPLDQAAAALQQAARTHHNSYVRYRALVILSGLGESAAAATMADLIADPDDRVRTVVYQWYEHHPSPAMVPTLVAALSHEDSEFVRPALVRAVAAHGADARARDALAPLVMRGADFFRGAVIEALGDYDGRYAVPDLIEVAKLDGPLQQDAVAALGEMGGAAGRTALSALRQTAPQEAQPVIAAALCLLGSECATQKTFLKETLDVAAASDTYRDLLYGVIHGLSLLAEHGDADALGWLVDAGLAARETTREALALGVGIVALRQPAAVIQALGARPSRDGVVALFRDAFDLLSEEDFAQEAFYAEARHVFWSSPAGSGPHETAALLIDQLEF